MLEAYGITGLPTDTYFAGGLTQQSVSGWTAWGRQSSNPQFQNPFVWNVRLNYSWIRARTRSRPATSTSASTPTSTTCIRSTGPTRYGGQFSRPTGAAANAPIYNLADFLVGARSAYDLVNPFVFELRQRMHFGYVQDDWQVAPNLTVNMGLRYEFGTPQWEGGNNLTNFDPATNTLLQANDGSIYDRALVNPDRNNFAPRVGVAYSLTPKTVLRSAYGMSYIHFNRLGGENLLSFNGPHVVPVTITQQPSQGLCAGNQAPTTCFRPTQQGYPEGLNVPANFNPINGRVNHIPSDLNTGYVQSWHVTVQRELLSNLLVDVAYVGNQSENLMILGDLNQARPNNVGENTLLQARRPIQGYQFIQTAFDGGQADYRALQVKVERRYSRRLLPAELVHLVAGARQRVGAPRDGQRRQQPRQLRQRRGRVRHLGLQPAAQQHDDAGLGTAVRRRASLGQRPAPGRRGHRGRLAPDGHQHDDERPAGEPDLLAVGAVLGERRADLSAEHLGRHLRLGRHADDQQLVQPRQRDRSRPIRRSRSAMPRATSRAARASARWTSACTRASASASGRPGSRCASRRSTCSTAPTSARRTATGRRRPSARSRRCRRRRARFSSASASASEVGAPLRGARPARAAQGAAPTLTPSATPGR